MTSQPGRPLLLSLEGTSNNARTKLTQNGKITGDQILADHLKWNSFLSERRKLLYVATPKVACTSIKWWFAALEGASREILNSRESNESDPDLVVHDEFHKVAPSVTGLSAESLQEALTSDEFFRFAVVRNPYKRIFSAWQSKLLLREPLQAPLYRDKDFYSLPIDSYEDLRRSFEAFLLHLIEFEAPQFWDAHWTPQASLLRPDLIAYTAIGRIENIGGLETALLNHLGAGFVSPFSVRRTNESLIPYDPALLSDKSVALIRELYKTDFFLFDYSTEPPPGTEAFSADQLTTALSGIRMLRGRHQRLDEIRCGLRSRNASLERKIAENFREAEALTNLLAEREARMAALTESVHERDSRVEELNDTLGRVSTENGELAHALGERDGQISGLMQALTEREARIDALGRVIAECEHQLAQMEQANLALRGQVSALHSSTSWRITEPMRLVARRLKSAGRLGALTRVARTVSTTHVGDGSPARDHVSVPSLHSLPVDFDNEIYIELNPDVQQSGMGPVEHYVSHGRFEGRPYCRPALTILSSRPHDASKASVLVVSHDASRTGAPILSLNLVESLSERYNVVVLLLGPGALETAFQSAATEVLIDPVIRRTPQLARYVIEQICDRHQLLFALVNSIESRVVLRALAFRFVPTVSLLHEFASYTRPRHAFREAFLWSAETVFSARVTKENALGEYPDLSEFSVEVVPQGRCHAPREAVTPELVEAERAFIARKMRPPGQADDAVVILGAGSVQLRKGVELFLECASRVAKAPGGEKCRFVWIGHGYNPDDDITYSVYLADQIRRAGLEQQVVFVRETSEIEVAYQSADIFLLSSRLDPLPNVAIDAMSYALPVVCFDRTTGIADFLLENGLGDACVADYLDSYEMARKILALAASPAFRNEIGERCRDASLASFRMQEYVSRLETLALSARERMSQERADAEAIRGCDQFLQEFAAPPTQREMPRAVVVGQYVRSWASGIDRRKPYPGFHPGIYREQGRVALSGADPLAAYLRAGQPNGVWAYPVISGPASARRGTVKTGRIALHIHAYFADLLPELLARLEQNAIRPDLFLSVKDEASRKAVGSALARYKGKVIDVRAVPNRGRDIGPFLTVFGEKLATEYDLIGHLHTKKSLDINDSRTASAWYSFLLENLLGGQIGGAMADQILARMSDDPSIGIVFPDDPNVVGWSKNLAFAEPLAKRLGVTVLPTDFNFPVGTMFWTRASVLASFVSLGLSWDAYPDEPLPYDGTMLHAIERLFGLVPAAQGLQCAVTHVPGVTR